MRGLKYHEKKKKNRRDQEDKWNFRTAKIMRTIHYKDYQNTICRCLVITTGYSTVDFHLLTPPLMLECFQSLSFSEMHIKCLLTSSR